MKQIRRIVTIVLAGVGLVAGLLAATGASADSESCREWRGEHREWKTTVLRRTLRGAPQSALDDAVFELLQREAWLTSCDVSVQVGRDELVGWRLAGRLPDEYANAVLESVLERAGFDVRLRGLFDEPAPTVANARSFRPVRRAGPR